MTEYRGKLYIFVDKAEDGDSKALETASGDVFAQRNPGEPLWYFNGWGVGANARSQYCARTSTSKLRSFDIYSEAMDFVRKKRKARPSERFFLVYWIDNRKFIVNGLEQIQQIDRDLATVVPLMDDDLGQRVKLETLTQRVGNIVANNALALLRDLARDGEEAARARFSAATYSRLWQVLKEAELVQGSA